MTRTCAISETKSGMSNVNLYKLFSEGTHMIGILQQFLLHLGILKSIQIINQKRVIRSSGKYGTGCVQEAGLVGRGV